MEFDLLLLLLSPMEAAIVALLTLIFLFYFILSKKKSSKLPLPPEIAGGWPVIGHLFYFNDGDNRPLARKLSDLADKYGPVFTFRLGLHRMLVISNYDAVKECYTKNDAVFANRPACLYGEYIGYNNAILFLANYGSYWRNIRKIMIQEVLSNSRLEKLKHMKIEKIRNEIKNLNSRIQNSEVKSVINLTDWLEKMNFGLQAIVKETLRLYPPSPLLVPHENTEECVVSGYRIPKGTRLYANVMKLQLDPKVWPNPEQFNPDRFLSTDINFRGQDYEFIPFGSGRRSCPGISYALQMEHLTIGHLIQGFNYQTPLNEPLDLKEGIGMTMPKVNPVEVIKTPRLATELYEKLS